MDDEGKDKPPALGVIDGGKSKHAPRNQRSEITRANYDKMCDEWVHGTRSIKDMSRKLGFAKATIRKAVNHGWPAKGWRPLADAARDYDAVQEAARGTNTPIALSPEQVQEAASWAALRRQHLDLALTLRILVAQSVGRLREAIEAAVATTVRPIRRVVYEELLDDKGNVFKRIPKIVTQDETQPPSIFSITAGLNELASTLARTGAHEIGVANSKTPGWMEADAKRGWSDLTAEELEHMEKTGQLPKGVTLEMLRGGGGRR